MLNKEIDIVDFVDNEYRNHGYYTLYNRGIPSFEDGMIPVQRKIFYVAKKYAYDNYQPMLKIIGGVTESGYHHGDKSSFDSAVNMATDYLGSNNNINLLIGYGNFGNRQYRESASARYVKAKYNKISDYIFLDSFLHVKSDDDMGAEPMFYYPIIPMILINHKSGIGLGHATNIPPHNAIDIVNYIIRSLKGKKTNKIMPYWRGVDVNIEQIDDGRFLLEGKYIRKGKQKINIIEIPPQYDRVKYIKILNDLEEKNIITSYYDNSQGDKFNIEVRFKKEIKDEEVIKLLKLYQYVNYNLTCIKEGKLKIYENIYQIIDDFIEYRLDIYEKRFKKMIVDLEIENKYLNDKMGFIKDAIKLISKLKLKITKDDLRQLINNKDNQDNFLNIPIYRFNDLYIEEIEERIKNNNDLLIRYNDIDIKSIYIKELLILKGQLSEF
jgi:DNA gyrase/topoisomerase IV subunit A